jgi:glycosyltransferase involved in cell wall biosynthesis
VLYIAWRAKPVILHANSLPAVVAASVPAVIFRKRLVWHVRDFSKCGGLMRLCGLAAWRVIAVSNAIRIHLERQGIDGRKIDVVYNGVDVVEGGVSRGSTGSDKLDFTFANVGQFIPWKKQTDFLDTVDAVTGSIINARFLLVGDDRFGRDSEYKAVILRRVRALRHTNRVRFCGWCDDMAHIWGEIDCLVHTAEQEPFGRVIIEAMMNGVPVIAVDSGGPGEIIRHGITGLLVKPGDSRGLVEAMIKMGRDVQLRTRMMLAAYKDAVSKFRADMPVKRVEEIYKMLLSEKGIPCESV